MPRIVRVVENVIEIKAGQLPEAGAPWWYSGRGTDSPTVDGGGAVGTPTEGQGLSVGGLHADVHALHVVIDGWDPGTTGIEVAVELNRAPGGSLEWAALDMTAADASGALRYLKPFRAQVLKSDFPNAGQAVTLHLSVIAQRLRWAVRAVGGSVAGTALHAAHEIIRLVD
jgi:hypothetical protein